MAEYDFQQITLIAFSSIVSCYFAGYMYSVVRRIIASTR